jgi:diamine N-acetyltransferase
MSEEMTVPEQTPGRDADVTLRAVTSANVDEIMRLRVAPAQEQFVADNPRSLATAAYHQYAWPRAIYADEIPVGFVMLYDNPHQPEYFLWRLMIDQQYQRLGFGRRAVEQVIDYVCGRPNVTALDVSYVPGEGSPEAFYASLGFVDTGEVDDGEHIMRLDLSDRAGLVDSAPRPLTHIVLFKFKKPTSAALAKAVDLLRGLDGKIAELRSIEVGLDVVHSGRSYDLGLITRFDRLADLKVYQEHPEHLIVLDYLRSVVSASVSLDCERD